NNPLLTGSLAPLTFSPSPGTPKTTVTWTSFHTTGAQTRISTIWILGHSGSPYLTDHYYSVAVNVGSEQRDFSYDGNGLSLYAATTGTDASGVITFATENSSTKAFNGTVGLTLEGGPGAGGV